MDTLRGVAGSGRVILLGLGFLGTAAQAVTKEFTFTSGTPISSSQINENFDDLFTAVNALGGGACLPLAGGTLTGPLMGGVTVSTGNFDVTTGNVSTTVGNIQTTSTGNIRTTGSGNITSAGNITAATGLIVTSGGLTANAGTVSAATITATGIVSGASLSTVGNITTTVGNITSNSGAISTSGAITGGTIISTSGIISAPATLNLSGANGASGNNANLSGGDGSSTTGGNIGLTAGTGATTGGNVNISGGSGPSPGGGNIIISPGGSGANKGVVEINGHLKSTGTNLSAGNLSSECGAGGVAIIGTNTRGTVILGSSPAGGFAAPCVITFNPSFTTSPHCVVSWAITTNGTPLQTIRGVASQTNLSVSGYNNLTSSDSFSYICMQ